MKARAHFQGTNEEVISNTTLNIHSCGLWWQASLQAWEIYLQTSLIHVLEIIQKIKQWVKETGKLHISQHQWGLRHCLSSTLASTKRNVTPTDWGWTLMFLLMCRNNIGKLTYEAFSSRSRIGFQITISASKIKEIHRWIAQMAEWTSSHVDTRAHSISYWSKPAPRNLE